MIRRTKKEGFTLIELLVSIAVLSVIMVVIGVTVWKIIDLSNDKKDKIMLSSIKIGAVDYINEFKQDDKYWFVDVNNTEIEYACTTVGMLINKGFLKEGVIGLKTDDNKIISKDTSIRVDRNKYTKVNNDFILFNDYVCEEISDIYVSFNVDGISNEGYSNWYNNDVTIDIKVSNLSQVGDYEYLYNGVKKEYTEENSISDKWKIIVDEQGENIDVCLNIIDLKDKQREFCLSDNNLVYNMDKERPSVPELSLNKNNNYELVSKNASDNVTDSSNLVYYLSNYVTGNKGNAVWGISSDYRVSNEVISSYVIDEAGNKSDVVTGKLNITNPETVESVKKYYCDVNGNYYDTYSEASNNCYYYGSGNVYEKTKYYCDNDSSREFDSANEAYNSCSYTETIETGYLCGEDECYYTNTFECRNNNGSFDWTVTGNSSTNHTCESAGYSGFEKIFYCDVKEPDVNECSSEAIGNVTTITYNCNYYCKGDVINDNYSSYSYYVCQLYGSYLDNKYDTRNEAEENCVVSESGTVSNKYYCSITNKYYGSQTEASTACSNRCSSGSYYDGGCYSFEK